MAYATLDDLQRRWRPIDPSEIERAGILLEDASLLLDAEFRRNGVEIDPDDEYQASVLRVVCCSIVKRVMASSNAGDYKQVSTTAGSFNEQFTFNNPSGDMYLTEREYKMLGISKRKSGIAQIMPATGGGCNEG